MGRDGVLEEPEITLFPPPSLSRGIKLRQYSSTSLSLVNRERMVQCDGARTDKSSEACGKILIAQVVGRSGHLQPIRANVRPVEFS